MLRLKRSAQRSTTFRAAIVALCGMLLFCNVQSSFASKTNWRSKSRQTAVIPNYGGAYIYFDSVYAPVGGRYGIKAKGIIESRLAGSTYTDSCDAEFMFSGMNAVPTGPGGNDTIGLRISFDHLNYTYFQPPAIQNNTPGFQPSHVYDATAISQGNTLGFAFYDRGFGFGGWHGDDNGNFEIEVSYLDAGMAIQKDSILFGSINLFATGTDYDTIQAYGAAGLRIDSIRLEGPKEFTVVSEKGNGPFSLVEQENNFVISFAPTVTGHYVAKLHIYSNADGKNSDRIVYISGDGIIPYGVPKTSLDTLNFGTQYLNTSTTIFDTLVNIGSTNLTIESITLSNTTDFSVIPQLNPPTVLGSGDAQILSFTFHPVAHTPDNLHTATYTITYDGGKTKELFLIGRDHLPLHASLFISEAYYAQAGDTIAVTQRLSSDLAQTLFPQRSFTERIQYDPTVVTLQRVDKGSLLLNPSWKLAYNTPSAGTLDINISSTVDTFTKAGQLIRMVYKVNPLAKQGEFTIFPVINPTFGNATEPLIEADTGKLTVEGSCAMPKLLVGAIASYIEQNSPNPFNPSTRIAYTVGPETQHVLIRLYDDLGREVSTLVDEEKLPGSYAFTLDGSTLPSGTYTYSFQAGAVHKVRQMILAR